VLLYDGECGLCNRVVRFLLRHDPRARLRFAPLQGPAAQAWLRARGLPAQDFSSLILVPAWERAPADYRLRTDAVFAALDALGGWRWLTWLRILPRPLRDAGYRLVARVRHRIFGRYTPRPLANPEWEKRFLE
jgi:predicted DCC family thiol-disulfide oxidoreductase YuxK